MIINQIFLYYYKLMKVTLILMIFIQRNLQNVNNLFLNSLRLLI